MPFISFSSLIAVGSNGETDIENIRTHIARVIST